MDLDGLSLIAQMEREAQRKSPPLDAEITQMLRRELGLLVDPAVGEDSGV